MALRLAEKGNDVIVVYRSKEQEAGEVVAAIEALGQKAAALQLDTAEVKSFDGFFSRLSGILKDKWNRTSFDILVNNAGISRPSAFSETSEQDFDDLMNVHFKGVYFLFAKGLAAACGRWADREPVHRPRALLFARVCGVRIHERGDRYFNTLYGQRTGKQGHYRECIGAGGDLHRFQ